MPMGTCVAVASGNGTGVFVTVLESSSGRTGAPVQVPFDFFWGPAPTGEVAVALTWDSEGARLLAAVSNGTYTALSALAFSGDRCAVAPASPVCVSSAKDASWLAPVPLALWGGSNAVASMLSGGAAALGGVTLSKLVPSTADPPPPCMGLMDWVVPLAGAPQCRDRVLACLAQPSVLAGAGGYVIAFASATGRLPPASGNTTTLFALPVGVNGTTPLSPDAVPALLAFVSSFTDAAASSSRSAGVTAFAPPAGSAALSRLLFATGDGALSTFDVFNATDDGVGPTLVGLQVRLAGASGRLSAGRAPSTAVASGAHGRRTSAVLGRRDGSVYGVEVDAGQAVLEFRFEGDAAVTGLVLDGQGRTYAAAGGSIALLAYDCPPLRNPTIYVSVAVLGIALCLAVFAVACWSAFAFGHALRQGSRRPPLPQEGWEALGAQEGEAPTLPPGWPAWKKWLARGYIPPGMAHLD
jgi:hypothetical protein